MWSFECFHQPEAILKHQKFREEWIDLFAFGKKKKKSSLEIKLSGTYRGSIMYWAVVLLASIFTTEYYFIWLLHDSFQLKSGQDCVLLSLDGLLGIWICLKNVEKGGKIRAYQERRLLHNFQWNFQPFLKIIINNKRTPKYLFWSKS